MLSTEDAASVRSLVMACVTNITKTNRDLYLLLCTRYVKLWREMGQIRHKCDQIMTFSDQFLVNFSLNLLKSNLKSPGFGGQSDPILAQILTSVLSNGVNKIDKNIVR